MESIYLQKNKNKYIQFFSCCILVKGFQRSCIYDIQREDIEFVPNTLIDFIEDIRGKRVSDVLEEYRQHTIAKEYLEFLEKKEFIFYSSIKLFPDLPGLSINEDTSEILFTTVVLSKYIFNNIDLFIRNIDQLRVKRLHIHIDNNNCMEHILKVLSFLDYSQVSNLSLSIPYQKIDEKIYENKRLTSILIYNSFEKKVKKNNDIIEKYIISDDSNLFLTRFNLSDIALGINAYNIAKNYNLALYKTIFINKDGIIKHNFSDKTNYGNIMSDIKDIRHNTIKKLSDLWNIKKDDITPCNVCEFRYCCTTTYIPRKSKSGYTIDCNYNPYNAEFN